MPTCPDDVLEINDMSDSCLFKLEKDNVTDADLKKKRAKYTFEIRSSYKGAHL